ncbi:DUF4489 domain-containing protein [Clostridium sp. UBA7503]|uniref:DUF4489 domain-containing protein n=1 Tax=Clostridium sp. UBA7503 TaxID=1946377 RepID=UPI0032171190
MNSTSKNYYVPCIKEHKEEEKLCATIVKCGNSSSVQIPNGSPIGEKFLVASLTLDTSCLCNPIIKLEYEANITTINAYGTVSFQVYKQCGNQFTPVPVGSQWVLSIPQIDQVGVTASTAFSFFVCDCDCFLEDCCTYTVVATNIGETINTIFINNSTLGAIGTCSENKCCRNNC